jgi:hypothetical protein
MNTDWFILWAEERYHPWAWPPSDEDCFRWHGRWRSPISYTLDWCRVCTYHRPV